MKSLLAQINDWLDAVKADRRLTANSVFKIAWQLTRKISSKEFSKTGRLITWQGVETLAAATGLSQRMARYAVRYLEVAGHLAVKTGRGPRQSNCYTLLEQKRQSIAAFPNANSGNPLPHSGGQKRQSSVSIAATGCTESGNGLPPNSFYNSFYNSSDDGETEDRGPRGHGLGPLGAKLRQRIGPAKFDDWIVKGETELLAQTADTVTLAVSTPFFADQIRNRFENDIVACSGAPQVKFEVRAERSA